MPVEEDKNRQRMRKVGQATSALGGAVRTAAREIREDPSVIQQNPILRLILVGVGAIAAIMLFFGGLRCYMQTPSADASEEYRYRVICAVTGKTSDLLLPGRQFDGWPVYRDEPAEPGEAARFPDAMNRDGTIQREYWLAEPQGETWIANKPGATPLPLPTPRVRVVEPTPTTPAAGPRPTPTPPFGDFRLR